jgi:hypothetical protein
MEQKTNNDLIDINKQFQDALDYFRSKDKKEQQKIIEKQLSKDFDNFKVVSDMKYLIDKYPTNITTGYFEQVHNGLGANDIYSNPIANRRSAVISQESIPTKSDGHKESNDKQEFELDWGFIESMAKRMTKNKTKYGKDNWKKPMDTEQLKQALFRHVLQVMKGNYHDEDKLDHLDAIALNCMFIRYQLLNNV